MSLEPAPVIVSAIFGGQDLAWLDGLRREHFPPDRNQLAAHLTLFHHLPPAIVPELKQRLSNATRSPAPRAEAAGLMNLGRGVAIRVVAPALDAIRDELADAFNGMLVPQDSSGWRPHVTIQNKVAPHEARALLALLSMDFQPRRLVIEGIATWYYRGGPWEPLSRHIFRR